MEPVCIKRTKQRGKMITLPKGTKDVIPSEAYKWHYVEGVVRGVAAEYCVGEIRTPVFEHTELFARGVGDTTDIVNKEMYTFDDKGGRSMTLKPEGTAGVARAFIEHSLYADAQPTKMYYITPVFRYERPQSGRLREHHQFGVEFFGSASPAADVEVISLLYTVYKRLGIKALKLHLNSIGCRECRKDYNAALKEYFGAHIDKMCPTCRERLAKNPLRILDCKEEGCRAIVKDAPVVLDYLCDDCRAHHEAVCKGLDALGIDYVVDPGIVGGKPCPGVGFGTGLERIILTMEAQGLPFGEEPRPMVYIAPIGDAERVEATKMAFELRGAGVACDTDIVGRGFKAQMKYADKTRARYLVVVGGDELASGVFKIKNMDNGAETEVARADLAAYFSANTEK